MNLTENQIKIMKIAVGLSQHNLHDNEFKTNRNFYNCYTWSSDIENLINMGLIKLKEYNFNAGFRPKVYILTNQGINALSNYVGINIKILE